MGFTLAFGLGADGWKEVAKTAPFHFIHVGAAADKLPDSLINQVHSCF